MGDASVLGHSPDSGLCRSALDYAHRCLVAPELASRPLGDLLADVARVFGASGAGLVQLPGGEPISGSACDCKAFPWQQRPNCSARPPIPAPGCG